MVTRIGIDGEHRTQLVGAAAAPGPPALSAERGRGVHLKSMLVLLRPQQWIKNAFVAAPLFFTPSQMSGRAVLEIVAGILCFCALSSAIYILNDYMDRDADRRHPEKRYRPLAADIVGTVEAFIFALSLAAVGLLGAGLLSLPFLAILVTYLVLNIAYCFGLKNVSILDVIIISIGFVLRVEAGSVLIAVDPSVWIVVCTGLLALFLAIAKRRDDVVKLLDASHRRSIDGYNKRFLDAALTIVLGALVVSYTIYTTDSAVMARLGSEHLYATVPFVLAGILRYLQITMVEKRSGSPTRLALSDRFLLLTILCWVAVFGALIYF